MKKSRIKNISLGLLIIIIAFAAYTYFDIVADLKEKEIACFEQLALKLADGTSPEEVFQKDFEKLLVLVEYSLVARSQMLEVSNRLKLNKDKPLSSRDLIILKNRNRGLS